MIDIDYYRLLVYPLITSGEMNQKGDSSFLQRDLKSKVTYIVILVFTKVDNMEIMLQYLHETACMETLFAKKARKRIQKTNI